MKIFFLCFLSILPINGYSVEYKYISNFGGINTYTNSSKIPDGDATDALNVLTDEGYLQKRPGSSLFFNTNNSSQTIKNIYDYVSSNKTRYLIYFASNSLYQTDLSSSVPVVISTINPDYPISAVSAWNKIFFTNKYEDPFYWSPGSGKIVVETMPHCKFIDFADERLYCVNNLEYGDSAMSISKYGEYDNWQIPTDRQLVSDDPNLLYFDSDDGQGITCFKATPFGKIVWKKDSMYVLKGYDNDTYYKYKLSDNIGCVDNGSIRFLKNTLIWLSRDGVYAWDGGSQLRLLSQDVFYDLKDNKQTNFNQNSILYNSKDSFDTGHYSDNTGNLLSDYYDALEPRTFRIIESTTQFQNGTKDGLVYDDNVGGLYIPEIPIYDNFDDGNYNANPVWAITNSYSAGYSVVSHNGSPMLQYYGYGSADIASQYSTNGYGRWAIYIDPTSSNQSSSWFRFFFVSSGNTNWNAATSGYFLQLSLNGNVCIRKAIQGTSAATLGCSTYVASQGNTYEIVRNVNSFKVLVGTNTILNISGDNSYTSSNYFLIEAQGGVDGQTYYFYADNIRYSSNTASGTYYSNVYDSGNSTNTANLLTTDDELESGTTIQYYYSQSSDSNTWSDWVEMFKSGQPNITNRYVKFKFMLSSQSSFVTPVLRSVSLNLRNSIGEYWSPVRYITQDVSKWLTFFASENKGNNTIKYYVRGSSQSFSWDNNTLAWSQISNNTIPPFDNTIKYIQFRVRFETTSPDDNKVNTVSLNWQEGDNIPIASATHNDKRYIICISTIPGSQFNDICYIFQDNGKWSKMSGLTIVSMNLFDRYILAGSNNGKIYKLFDTDTYTDDGQLISAYWITGDMMFDAPFMNKIIREIWVDAESQNTNLTIGYSTNKSDTFKEKSISLFDMGKYLAKRVEGLPDGYDYGRYIRFKISNNDSSNFKLNSAIILYDVEKLKPY